MQLELTDDEAQFLYRACNFILNDALEKKGSPLQGEDKEIAIKVHKIKEKIKLEADKSGFNIKEDIVK
jgi:hypothetical protein